MYTKGQKIEFLDLKYLLFSGIFLNRIGRYPPPPFRKTIPAKNLTGIGGSPPPPLEMEVVPPLKLLTLLTALWDALLM